MRRVKVALVGLGSVSQRGILPHLACADAQARVETVACVDPVPGRAEETARRFGWREAYADYDEMLRRADVEAVLLATPIPLHAPQSQAALRAGKHVYVQKTMATTAADASAVVEEAERRGLRLVASPGQMLRPAMRLARDLVRAGVLGQPYWALSDASGGGHEGEAFRAGGDVLSDVNPAWYYAPGGGPMNDMAVYALHALTGVFGPARRVTGMSGIGVPVRHWKGQEIQVRMDDNTCLVVDFGDSVFAMVGGHNSSGPPSVGFARLMLSGSEGWIETARDGAVEVGSRRPITPELAADLAAVLVGPDGEPLEPGAAARGPRRLRAQGGMPHVDGEHTRIQESHVYADIMHLVDCIVEDRAPEVTGAQACHVVEIIEKGYLAAATGAAQTLSTTF